MKLTPPDKPAFLSVTFLAFLLLLVLLGLSAWRELRGLPPIDLQLFVSVVGLMALGVRNAIGRNTMVTQATRATAQDAERAAQDAAQQASVAAQGVQQPPPEAVPEESALNGAALEPLLDEPPTAVLGLLSSPVRPGMPSADVDGHPLTHPAYTVRD